MINQILSIFDPQLIDKCWIGKYGRLAITAKQFVEGRPKRFPVSCSQEESCDTIGEYFTDLVPDDTKTGVAFWKTVQPVTYTEAPGISYRRGMKRAEGIVEFVAWVNIRKVTGENSNAAWCSDHRNIVLDALKTLDCKRGAIPSGLDYVKNLKVQVVKIGDANTWRTAMAEYSIDNPEAISVWPYTGFTLTVKLSFMVKAACIPDYSCYNVCPDLTYTGGTDVCSGSAIELSVVLSPPAEGYIYTWQELIDEVWTPVAGATGADLSIEGRDDGTYQFRAVLTHCFACNITGDPVTVVVALNDFSVSASSDVPEACPGYQALLSSMITGGTGTITYQWQQLLGGNWTDIAGATGATYQTPALAGAEGIIHSYRLSVTRGGCEEVSNTVTIGMQNHPEIFTAYIPQGGSALLTSEVLGGIGGSFYQWQVLSGGVWYDIDGANDSVWDTNAGMWGTGTFTVRVIVYQEAGCGGVSDPMVVEIV